MAGCGARYKTKSLPEDFVIPTITTTHEDHPEIPLHDLIDAQSNKNNNNKNNNNNNNRIPSTTNRESSKNGGSNPLIGAGLKKDNKIFTSCSSVDSDTIYLFVSGKTFCVKKSALLSFPNTKLGQLALRHCYQQGRVEYVFDRNSKIVAAILDFYRTGELHLPSNLCSMSIRRELKYWGIPDDLISECCYGRYKDALHEMQIVDELDKASWRSPHPLPGSYKERIWNVMEKPGINSSSWIWLGVYMTFICMSIILVSISTCNDYREDRDIDGLDSEERKHESTFENLLNTKLNPTLAVLDVLGLIFFTIEPCVRLWASPDPREHLKEFLNLLDFFLSLDHWLCLCLEVSDHLMTRHRSARVAVTVLRSALSLRVMRIFHLTRKNVKTKVLLLTFRASLVDILLLLLGLSIAVMIFATLIYYAEMIYDTDNFNNIPQAIWWSIITMTTVGYGDYYPTTFPGYVVGVACALSGLLLLSMPIAITATNFNTYYCGLVARDQRHRRSVALMKCGGVSENNEFGRKNSADDSFLADDCTMTTVCGDETKDDVFWLDDFSDFKSQCLYQSDGALEVRGNPNCSVSRASSLAILHHAISENSLRPNRETLATQLARRSPGLLQPNHRQQTKHISGNSLSTSCILTETKREVRNYNSINSDKNGNFRNASHQNCTKPPKTEPSFVDSVKKRKRKYRPRRKTRVSSLNLCHSNDSTTHSDCQ